MPVSRHLALLVLPFLAIACQSTPPVTSGHAATPAQFLPGDSITIASIQRTSPTTYTISGDYTLASHDKASLAAFVTSNDPTPTPVLADQTKTLTKGSGPYTLTLHYTGTGSPHISFYDGASFGGRYFEVH